MLMHTGENKSVIKSSCPDRFLKYARAHLASQYTIHYLDCLENQDNDDEAISLTFY